MGWDQINKDLGLPTYTAQGLEVKAGQEYLLIGAQGSVVDGTQYLMVGYEDGKAQLETADGFKFLVRLDDLTRMDHDTSAISSEVYLEAEQKIAARKQAAADRALKIIDETFHPFKKQKSQPYTFNHCLPPRDLEHIDIKVSDEVKDLETDLEPYRKQVEPKPPERIQDMIKTYTRVRDFKFHPGTDRATYTLADMVEFVKHCDKIRGY